MLEFAILGLLKERAMHGYDLRRRLREDFGPLANLSFGSLYPALARLEASGAIAVVTGPPASDRFGTELPSETAILSTGSLSGERATTVARRATAKVAETLGARGTRGRKVYEITPAGEALFVQLLETPTAGNPDPRSFAVRLAFARHLSPQARIRLLERRRMELADRLRLSSNNLENPHRTLDFYERSLADHARESVANDLSWIEGLLEGEQRAFSEHGSSGPGSPARRLDDHEITDDNDDESRRARQGVALTNDGGITA
jgi:DNA-binding PadR family transcriptional regulator